MKKKLLIADDEINFSITLFNYIQLHNSNIDVVGISRDGEETIRNVMELKPDIILLDLQMPKKTGLDVIYYIQRNVEFDKIDIIITSGDTTLINKTNILKNDFIKYVLLSHLHLKI